MILGYIVFLHLFAFLVVGVFYKKISNRLAQSITSGASMLSWILSGFLAYDVIFQHNVVSILVSNWINIGGFLIEWSLQADSLTAVMLMVVNAVSTLVHIYSIGYMAKDENVPKFMSFLSLFTFFMLLLVTSNNLVQLFVGWEGVGLCSYLLIGYWYKKESACSAAIKAFVVNRVSDVFFILGLLAIYTTFDSLLFSEIFSNVSNHSHTTTYVLGHNFRVIDFICIMLFIGCMGKSAQIGFHTWLPDAMEGPTPVSALIHAATMVTAGVFLVVRCSPLFEHSQIALDMIIFVGGTTAFFAGTIALVQNDIKKIIAYSTCSQLGYMFLACGVSAYPVAIFHLVTHAYFKALLFLGAGSIIHSMGGEQDIRNMGGIRQKIPYTYVLMFIGSLSLSGVFPFAGFFSKDTILESALVKGTVMGDFGYFMGIVTVILTAFYSFRLIIMTFHMPAKNASVSLSAHEPSKFMLVPLIILSVAATFSGVVGEYLLKITDQSLEFWGDSIYIMPKHNNLGAIHEIALVVKTLPSIFAILTIVMTYILYLYKKDILVSLKKQFEWIYDVLLNKYYIDEIYDVVFVRVFKNIAEFCKRKIEKRIIDDFGPHGSVSVVSKLSCYVRQVQTGLVYHYATIMIIGFILVMTWFVIQY
jgi:NADH-quinone oxidoreductase subunit L